MIRTTFTEAINILPMRCMFFLGMLFLFISGFSQSGVIGLPPVTNYPKTQYRAGTQNWDIAQDEQGVLFFANNEGLLRFDGAFWSCYPIANGTCVRSLCIAPDHKIYVGGQGEIGYFQRNPTGCLVYHSLTPAIPYAQRQFEDVWNIALFHQDVFFRTNDRVFRLHQGEIQTYIPGGPIVFMGKTNQQLLIQNDGAGLMAFDGKQFSGLSAPAKTESIITEILPLGGDSAYVTTLKSGIFLFTRNQLSALHTPIDPFLKEKRIYAAARLSNGQLALGTSLGGLVILNADFRPLQLLQKGMGIQNNNTLSVFADHAQNLWLGLDNGIDHLDISSPFYRVIPDGDLEGMGYAALVFENRVYLGTSNGLYAMPWNGYLDPFRNPAFVQVKNTVGQVWGLGNAGGAMLLAQHEGAFGIKGTEASALSRESGYWQFVALSDTTLLAGRYDGLALFTRRPGGNWAFARKLKGLNESCRIMVRENDGTLWISHPYRGIFRVRLTPGLDSVESKLFGKSEGLPSNLFNYVFLINGKAIVAAERGIYRYNPGAQRFVPATEFNNLLGTDKRILCLKEDAKGNIWFATAGNTGILWVEDDGLHKKIRRQDFPQLAGQLVGGFEHIYPADERHVFLGSEKGFIHFDPERLAQLDTTLQITLSSVRLLLSLRDSLLSGSFAAGEDTFKPELSSRQNALRFSFSATAYGAGRHIVYSCKLEGLDPQWSSWGTETSRDFTSLRAGSYTFRVKARNEYGVESREAVFSFTILPPWYAGKWAIAFYLLLAGGSLFALFRRQQIRFDKEKDALETAHQQETREHQQRVEQSEKEINRLRAEKLQSEVAFKNQELALATMHLVQKGEILSNIQQELEKTLEKKTTAEIREDIRRISRMLQYDAALDNDWEQFAYHFDQVYGDFLKRLRERYPQLSTHDYRLCAYLRLNLSTKEIAHLLNISVRGVEGSRYRLRKKLDLPGDENLVEFMMNV